MRLQPRLSLPDAHQQWDEGRDVCDQEGFSETSKPWVVVLNPGQGDEEIWNSFSTYSRAVGALDQAGQPADVMKRLADGTLTTEF